MSFCIPYIEYTSIYVSSCAVYHMRKGYPIIVMCKRCGARMIKWKREPEIEKAFPFRFDSICGHCITKDERYEIRMRLEKNHRRGHGRLQLCKRQDEDRA